MFMSSCPVMVDMGGVVVPSCSMVGHMVMDLGTDMVGAWGDQQEVGESPCMEEEGACRGSECCCPEVPSCPLVLEFDALAEDLVVSSCPIMPSTMSSTSDIVISDIVTSDMVITSDMVSSDVASWDTASSSAMVSSLVADIIESATARSRLAEVTEATDTMTAIPQEVEESGSASPWALGSPPGGLVSELARFEGVWGRAYSWPLVGASLGEVAALVGEVEERSQGEVAMQRSVLLQ